MNTTTIQRHASMDEIAAEMDRRGEVIERLEAERDAAQARSVSRGKHLRKLRDRLILIRDEIADEGDRVYFGSTNHADDFRELVQALDDFHWDRIMEERDERDVIADCRAANERARIAESDLATEIDHRVAAEAEIDRLKHDLVLRDGGGLKLLYEIREALGWNDKTSLSIMPAEIRRRDDILKDADKEIDAIHAAFGAPGDYGYETREGKALFSLYKFQVRLRDVIR